VPLQPFPLRHPCHVRAVADDVLYPGKRGRRLRRHPTLRSGPQTDDEEFSDTGLGRQGRRTWLVDRDAGTSTVERIAVDDDQGQVWHGGFVDVGDRQPSGCCG